MTQFWLNNPGVLMKNNNILDLWPTKKMTQNEKLNSITRLIIILTFVGYIVTKNIKFILSFFMTLLVIVILYKTKCFKNIKNLSLTKEAFTNPSIYNDIKHNFTQPTKKNPLMNVMLTEYEDNPTRKTAAPSFNPVVEEKINQETKNMVISNFGDPEIENKLFKDLGDSLNFDHSMRSWYPMPNTQIPNDQKSFANFCYGDMPSCKEGSTLACSKNLPHRWMKN